MTRAPFRLSALLFVVPALLLLGAPNNPVLERAVARAFNAIFEDGAITPIDRGASARPDTSASEPTDVSSIAPADVDVAAPAGVDASAPTSDGPMAHTSDGAIARASDSATDVVAPERPKRSLRVMLPFYGAFATLEAFDVYTTRKSLALGGQEVDPIMAPFVGKAALFIAVKAFLGAGTIINAERLRGKSRVAPIVLMSVFNAVYAVVVANNYRVIHQLQ